MKIDLAALVDELELRKDGRVGSEEHREADLDADRPPDVDRGGFLVVLDHPHRSQAHDLVPRGRLEIGPLAARPRTEAGLEVLRDDGRARTVEEDPSLVHPDRPLAQLRHGLHLVRDEEHRAAGLAQVLHAPEAAALELRVTDGEHLVHEQDLGLEVSRDGEGEPHRHPARVALDRRVDELLDAGELDDVRELARDHLPLHPEHGPVQVHVLATRELRVEARAHLEQAADASANDSTALRRIRDAGQDPEERRLARSVATDDAEHFALSDVEGDVLHCPDLLVVRPVVTVEEPASRSRERVAKRSVRALELPDSVELREVLD